MVLTHYFRDSSPQLAPLFWVRHYVILGACDKAQLLTSQPERENRESRGHQGPTNPFKTMPQLPNSLPRGSISQRFYHHQYHHSRHFNTWAFGGQSRCKVQHIREKQEDESVWSLKATDIMTPNETKELGSTQIMQVFQTTSGMSQLILEQYTMIQMYEAGK